MTSIAPPPPPSPQQQRRAFGVTYILSATSACAAEAVTFPLDIIKTRLQAQGERALAGATPSTTPARGMVATLTGIVREEGLRRVYRGLTPACLRHCVYSGIRVGAYEFLREKVFLRDADGSFPLWKGVSGGGVCAGCRPSPRSGHLQQPAHVVCRAAGAAVLAVDVMLHASVELVACWTALFRSSAVVAASRGPSVHLVTVPSSCTGVVCGMAAGAFGQLFASPTDLVKVQMQLDGKRIAAGQPPRYKGTADAFATIFREASGGVGKYEYHMRVCGYVWT